MVRIDPDAFDFVAFDGLGRRRDVPVELFVVFVPLDGVETFFALRIVVVVVVVSIATIARAPGGVIPRSRSLLVVVLLVVVVVGVGVVGVATVGLLTIQFVLTFEQG